MCKFVGLLCRRVDDYYMIYNDFINKLMLEHFSAQ